MKEILWFVIVCWATTAGAIWLGFPILWTGLRTGKLLARGRIYDRNNSPGMYRGGVAFGWLFSPSCFGLRCFCFGASPALKIQNAQLVDKPGCHRGVINRG